LGRSRANRWNRRHGFWESYKNERFEANVLGSGRVLHSGSAQTFHPQLLIFSKHLAGLDYEQLGKTAKEFGFDGVDLTVRPKGHVLPERITEDLPRAVGTLRRNGLAVPMITTELTSANDPAAIPTLRAGSSLAIPFFKPGYWRYAPGRVEPQIQPTAAQVRRLAMLAAEHKIAMGLHNHSGNYIGEAVWDTWGDDSRSRSRWTGFYYDPGHAAIEGGLGGRDVSLRLALPRLKMVSAKEFYWRRDAGAWKPVWCPLGEGVVDWTSVISALRKAGYNGPISLHQEYVVPDMLGALRKDLAFLRSAVESA
jgi:L-ribulose-5-phosphate 3-epimerase